jgi:hypothetical protein
VQEGAGGGAQRRQTPALGQQASRSCLPAKFPSGLEGGGAVQLGSSAPASGLSLQHCSKNSGATESQVDPGALYSCGGACGGIGAATSEAAQLHGSAQGGKSKDALEQVWAAAHV